MKLTTRAIEGLACPEGQKDRLVFDDVQAGLAVRVTAGGGKSYLAQYTISGQRRRVPLGSFQGISLSAARDATAAILGDVAKGIDPAAERKAAATVAKINAAREALTLAILIDDWHRLHLVGRSQKYASESVRALRVAFAARLSLPAASLDRKAVVKVLDDLADREAMAKATAVYGRALYGWACKRGTVDTNPFEGIPVVATTRRDRVLNDDELAAIWRAADPKTSYGAIIRMLILTAQRREEVGGVVWDELDPDLTTWTLPAARAKNGVAHIIPLSVQANSLLAEQMHYSDFVFPGRKGAFSGWSKSKERLDSASGVTGWTVHDLRRTVATGLQRLGVRLEVVEAILNHVSGSRSGVAGIYQRHNWAEEKRAALTAWGEHVAAVVEGRVAVGNVVTLTRGA